MRTTLICWTIALAALGTGCTHPSQAQTELETHRALFAQAALPSYQFLWQRLPDSTRGITVTVSGGDIVSAVYLDGHQPVSEVDRRGVTTVDGVFDLIADRLDDANEVDVTYDAKLGYPSYVFVDRYKTAASDDDMTLLLSDFVTTFKPADTGKPALRTELAAQRALFVEPASYSFTSTVSCYCGPDSHLPIRISVTDSAVTRVVYRDNKQPVPDAQRASSRNLPWMFDDIESLLRDNSGWRSDELIFAYDPVWHYPARVTLISEMADGGYDVQLTEFVTPADAP